MDIQRMQEGSRGQGGKSTGIRSWSQLIPAVFCSAKRTQGERGRNILKLECCEISYQSFGESRKQKPLRSFHPLPCSTACGGNHCFPWEKTAQLKKYPAQTPPPCSYILHPPLLLLGALCWTTRTHFSKEITSKCCKPLHPPLNHYHFINLLKHFLLLMEDLKYFLPFFSKILYFGKLRTHLNPASCWITVSLIPLPLQLSSGLKKAQIF